MVKKKWFMSTFFVGMINCFTLADAQNIDLNTLYNSTTNDLCTHTFDSKAYAEPLESFLKNPEIPLVDPKDTRVFVLDTQGTIPKDVMESFLEIVTFVFGNKTELSLKLCLGCSAASVIQDKTIYISIDLLNELKGLSEINWPMTIRTLLAHEISHQIHEAITLKSKDGLSPQNSAPLLRKNDYLNLDIIGQDKSLIGHAMTRFLVRNYKSHSEVDGIGATILLKMGYSVNSVVVGYQQWLMHNSHPALSMDTEIRIRSLNYAFLSSTKEKKCLAVNEDAEVLFWENLSKK